MNFLKDFSINFIKNINWIYCIIISIIVGITSFYLVPFSDTGILYLLSAISQGLAAIFALVFTVTLMSATMSGKYTAVDKFFSNGTKNLMVLFVVGIVSPLLLLKMSFDNERIYNFFTSGIIGLTTFCIIAIIPHLKSCNDILKFDIGLNNIISELDESINLENYSRANTAVYDLIDIGKSAIQENKATPLYKINSSISNYAILALERQGGILPSFSPQTIIYALNELGMVATIAYMDDVARQLMDTLELTGKLLIDKGFAGPWADDIIFNIHNIGCEATKRKLIHASTFSLTSLLAFGTKKSSIQLSKKANRLFGICAAHYIRDFPEKVDFAYSQIKSMNIDVNNILLDESNYFMNKHYMEDIKKFLEGFNSL